MSQISNQVFFGCNYNDKKIKSQFDNLKKRIEDDTPLSCTVIDKRSARSAQDLWKLIKQAIENSAACVFDITGFRPNVVLELGYALSIKSEDQIFITWRKRMTQGKKPEWLLSDISHLQRHEYVNIRNLESYVREQLSQIPYSVGWSEFFDKCNSTNAEDKYKACGLQILKALRDKGSRSDQQVKAVMAGTNCHFTQMIRFLKKSNLIIRTQGPYGKFSIPEERQPFFRRSLRSYFDRTV